jgi:hypothetical protein
MCRSKMETGTHGAVTLSFTLFVSPSAATGIAHIGVVGSVPGSSATTTAVLHISKA